MTATEDIQRTASAPDSENATHFVMDDVPKGERLDGSETYEQFYKSLELINRDGYFRYNRLGKCWNDRKNLYLADNLAIFDGVASQLELRPSEKNWGRRIFAGFKFKEHSVPGDKGMGPALSAFCLCSYIRWKNGGRTHPNHKNRNTDFRDVQSRLGFTNSQASKRYGQIESELRRERGI